MLPTTQTALTALSPLDGRYSAKLPELASLLSEFALTKKRVFVEVEYLLFLAKEKLIARFSVDQQRQLRSLVSNFSIADAVTIQKIEKKTRHDVKAVEYFVRKYLKKHSLPNEEFVHFALTSEDTNSLAYGLLLQQALKDVVVPELLAILRSVSSFALRYKDVPMPARTHGQLAVPTTVGKEFAVFGQRLLTELEGLCELKIEGKLTGAVGNLNAHTIAFTNERMLSLSEEFVKSLGLVPNLVTTQTLPPENYSRVFSSLVRINGILLDLNQDCWRYISDDYFGQKLVKAQVGSSTMPQKINPIDFENSEGNLGLANALLLHFIVKLPVSRLQRDLSDSTVKRSIGSAFGHCLLAYQSLSRGLSKVTVNSDVLAAELLAHWEVLAESYQLILRQNQVKDGYELLKALTQGKQLSDEQARAWISSLKIDSEIKEALVAVTPLNYLGLAVELTDLVISRITKFLERTK